MAFHAGVDYKIFACDFAYGGHQGGDVGLFEIKRKFFVTLFCNQGVLRHRQWQCAA